MEEIAEFLELSPARGARQPATFYEEYWLKPKGAVFASGPAASLSCEICQSREITQHLQQKLGVELGETNAGRALHAGLNWNVLGSCGTAPVMLCKRCVARETSRPQDGGSASFRVFPQDPEDYKDPVVYLERWAR